MAADSPRTARPLDALNFFLADVRDGLGPYLAIYLLVVQHWDAAAIGTVMSVAAIAGIVAQTPAGALIDGTTAKRAAIVVAALAVTAGSLVLPFIDSFWFVAATQAATGVAAAVFPPAVAAITLGIVGPKAFGRRVGRNEAFNHAGNATAATIAGVTAYFFGPIAVFWLMAAMAIASIIATLSIPAEAIDHELARGLAEDAADPSHHDQPSGWRAIIASRPLMIFAACTTLFHFANAAMLPLVGQKLALVNQELATTLMSVCIVAAQAVMVPVAMITGAKADAWGRKPIFLVALAVLALRGALYPFSDNPYWLVGVQLLDGVGAGIFGALFPLIVADLTRGTGRFNVSQGAIATAQGIGAALSAGVAGVIVVGYGYGAAFLFLAGVAAGGLALFWLGMPETRDVAPQGQGAQEPRGQEQAVRSTP
ncbi:MFS transporter [Plastoroseomonas arctica]|uniref:MFS transporter n=1 Tax=Plastoroseomonas arctica TaxID=1509237 RepID=A0AAF1KSK9_9PROT|nr:MFS transporter [Plastoroseomonas arctica]MBR0654912.1 MFS transporter [Plastoroseomonas arctica]